MITVPSGVVAEERVLRVVIVTNIPAPYRQPVYALLNSEAGIDLHVVYCSGREPDRAWDLGAEPCPTTYLHERFVSVAGRYIHVNPDVWAALRALRPDVVITTGFNPTHLLAFAWARLHGARHVCMTDGTWRSEQKLGFVHRWVRRRVFAASQAFIGASEGAFALYRSYGVGEGAMFKSHLCANNAAFAVAGDGAKQFDLMFCGRFVEIKNPLFVLDVAQGVARQLGRRVSVLFVGSGELESALRAQAGALADQLEVHFAGFAAQSELPGWYAASRLFLFPTAWEPWGVVANESLAAGVPVLVTPQAGVVGELVLDGVTGRVLPLVRDDWVTACSALLADAPLRAQMAVACRVAVAEYSYANAAQGMAVAARHAAGLGVAGVSNPAIRPRPLRPEVLVVQRRMTHYRVPFFECLRAELAERGVVLRVAHGEPTIAELAKNDSGVLPWAQRLRTHYWLGGRLCWLAQGEALRGASLVVLTPENKMLSNLPLQYGHRDVRVVLWGHGANLQGDPRSLRERFKRRVARQADWWLAYTEMCRPLVERSGFPANRLTILQNAVDTTAQRRDVAAVAPEQMVALRTRLGLVGARVGIYVGSLYAEKRIAFMLAAALKIRQQVPDFEFLIVGGGPDAPRVAQFCAQHAWAHYAGVLKGHDKAQALALARVMLNPGLVGLGVLDSFVAGVPMLTTDCGVHSPEIAYLQSGSNGVMTADTEAAFVAAACAVLQDNAYWQQLKAGCEQSAALYTVENMARNFADGIEQCLATPMLRGRA